ncbi:MAG: hypothetical protein V1916_00855 [Patescibacteria group bacterium]
MANPEHFQPDEPGGDQMAEDVLREQAENRELSPEEKKNLVSAWVDMVVGGQSVPAGVETWTNVEVSAWLSKTVQEGTDQLLAEWNLEPDEQAVAAIQVTTDPDERTVKQVAYIRAMNSRLRTRKKEFDQTNTRTKKWDSWPKNMRETQGYNCVGASLIGERFLSRAGIESDFGNPISHVMNVATLANGERWYVDFNNNVIKKINPVALPAEEQTMLRIDDPRIEYQLIRLTSRDNAPLYILGNLSSLRHEVTEPPANPTPAELREIAESTALYQQYASRYAENDFGVLKHSLYPALSQRERHPSVVAEEERMAAVDGRRNIEQPVQDFLNAQHLSEEQEDALARELKLNLPAVADLLHGKINALPESTPPLMKGVFDVLLASLNDFRDRRPELYDTKVDELLKRWAAIELEQ